MQFVEGTESGPSEADVDQNYVHFKGALDSLQRAADEISILKDDFIEPLAQAEALGHVASPVDYDTHMTAFSRLDANGDDVVSKEEWRQVARSSGTLTTVSEEQRRLREAAAVIQGLIQGHHDGLIVEEMLNESELESAAAIQSIVRGSISRSEVKRQRSQALEETSNEAAILERALNDHARIWEAVQATKIKTDEVAETEGVEEEIFAEEEEEECIFAPGSPTGR